ncbi:O-antigen ligase family protein [Candidatus Sumerlaeota bacterium]|nr:O-antigen ligase family protein [Candidatus Sumerlaeota bacterium]
MDVQTISPSERPSPPGLGEVPALPALVLVMGALASIAAFATDEPLMILALVAGAALFMLTGLSLELLLMGMILNLMMGSARLFESSILNVNRLLGIAILGGLMIRFVLVGAHRINLTRITGVIAVFGAAVFIGAIFAVNQGLALSSMRHYIRVFLVFFLVANLIPDRRWLRWQILAIVGGGVLLVLAGFAQGYDVYAQRSGGILSYQDYNAFGLVLVTVLPLAVWGMRHEPSGLLRLVHTLAMVMLLVGVFQSKSRGALVGIVIMGGVLFAAREWNRKWILPLVLIAAIGLPLVAGDVLERFATVLEIFTKDPGNLSGDAQNVMNRINYVRAGIPMFLEHPITGVGSMNFPDQYIVYMPRDSWWRVPRAAHNTYLQVVTETGLLGSIPYFLLLLWLFQAARGIHLRTLPSPEGRREEKPREFPPDPLISSVSIHIVASLAVYCTGIIFLAALTMDVFWILAGMVSALVVLHREPESSG